MSYLIDSHALVWHKKTDSRMSHAVINILEDATQELWISHAVLWELMIKESLGKLEIPGQVAGLHKDWLGAKAATELPMTWHHLLKYRALPLIHRDPFDRMLVAQALEENLTILTADPHIPQYPGVKTLW